MSDSFSIRQPDRHDSAILNDYMNTVLQESSFLRTEADEYEQNDIHNLIDRCGKYDNWILLSAWKEDRLAGLLTFRGGLKNRTAHTGEAGLTVLKEFWGQGCGTALMTSFLGWAGSHKSLKKIKLCVRGDNARAIALYGKFGFEVEGHEMMAFFEGGRYYHGIWMGLIL